MTCMKATRRVPLYVMVQNVQSRAVLRQLQFEITGKILGTDTTFRVSQYQSHKQTVQERK